MEKTFTLPEEVVQDAVASAERAGLSLNNYVARKLGGTGSRTQTADAGKIVNNQAVMPACIFLSRSGNIAKKYIAGPVSLASFLSTNGITNVPEGETLRVMGKKTNWAEAQSLMLSATEDTFISISKESTWADELYELTSRNGFTEPVGRFNREEVYDRKVFRGH